MFFRAVGSSIFVNKTHITFLISLSLSHTETCSTIDCALEITIEQAYFFFL